MIKSEDLRIGDLVKISRDCMFPKGTKCVVTDINPLTVFEDKKGTACLSAINDDDDGPWWIWCCSIEGIPLAPELLIKNGFKEEQHKRTALWNGTTSTITTSVSISCTRSRGISLLPALTTKSYEKYNALTNSSTSFGRWA